MKLLRVSFGFASTILLATSLPLNAAALPTEEQVAGIKMLCGGGSFEASSVSAELDAAIESWRKASGGVELEIAQKDLAGALGQVEDDQNLAPVYRVYIDCVRDSIQQFLNRKNQPTSQNVSINKYYQIGKPKIDPKDWEGPGTPVADFVEVMRGDIELVAGENYWISHNNQSIPPEQPCRDGSSIGNSCSLDDHNRLIAYTRVSCSEPPANGLKVSKGCSNVMPLYRTDRKDTLVQCCFYADGPEAKELKFGHSHSEFLSINKR